MLKKGILVVGLLLLGVSGVQGRDLRIPEKPKVVVRPCVDFWWWRTNPRMRHLYCQSIHRTPRDFRNR